MQVKHHLPTQWKIIKFHINEEKIMIRGIAE